MKLQAACLALLLAGCATPKTVIKEVPVEIKVPVTVPCLSGERPAEPTPLSQQFTREQWDYLSLEERQAKTLAQALEWKAFGIKLNSVTAGCR